MRATTQQPAAAAKDIPFLDLSRQYKGLEEGLMAKFAAVLASEHYILGPELAAFEEEFALYQGVRHVIGVGNGTDALVLILQALGISPGDEVLTCANPFLASASCIALTGATPVLVDVACDFNMDPDRIAEAITPRTKAILAIHLHGRPAQMHRIKEIAERQKLYLIEDCAQAVGASIGGQKVGNFGIAGGFSFHPNKILSAMGDGGAIVTNDPDLAALLRELRNHGLQNGDCQRWAPNSRLADLQAGILRAKLPYVDGWIQRRRTIAGSYRAALQEALRFPEDRESEGYFTVYANCVVESARRDELVKHMQSCGIEARVFYRKPLHKHAVATRMNWQAISLPETERQANHILALPIFPEMTDEEVQRVIGAVRSFNR